MTARLNAAALWLIRRVLASWIACAIVLLVVTPTQTLRLVASQDFAIELAGGRTAALLAGSLFGAAVLLAVLAPRRVSRIGRGPSGP